jgi:hypothetical protein
MVKMLTGINPAYFRFKGRAELRVYKGNVLVDKHVSSSAVWELMYFGNQWEVSKEGMLKTMDKK